jgi:hypothetical protein
MYHHMLLTMFYIMSYTNIDIVRIKYELHLKIQILILIRLCWFMMFNTIFNNILVISWQSVLLVEKIGAMDMIKWQQLLIWRINVVTFLN